MSCTTSTGELENSKPRLSAWWDPGILTAVPFLALARRGASVKYAHILLLDQFPLLWYSHNEHAPAANGRSLSTHDWPSFQCHVGTSLNATEALAIENSHLQQALATAEESLANEKMQVARLDKTLGEAERADDLDLDNVDRPLGFAYIFYATSDPHACSVLVNIYRLHNVLSSTLPIHVLASSDVSPSYIAAFEEARAIVHVEETPSIKDTAAGYCQDCMLKLLAFKMQLLDPTLKRVLAFDSDQLIMRNLDHLFVGLPDVDLAASRAYWLAKDFLASTFLMIKLSNRL
ncbi:hypothetical protein LTR22_023287 [Elasticomyces elasticus]|nr:hypothetical protein LTR22_023287 [Elasticomyces elasticus]